MQIMFLLFKSSSFEFFLNLSFDVFRFSSKSQAQIFRFNVAHGMTLMNAM